MKLDLTKGKITSTLLLFALPMILGDMLQQMYNVTDTLIVGQCIGTEALAAVGSAYTLMTFLNSVILGLCMGSGTYASICYGKKDLKALKQGCFQSFVMIGIVTIVMNVFVFVGIDAIMHFLRVPEEVYTMMRSYLWIIFLGISAVFLYNYFASLLRAVGNSSVPLYFLGVSAVTNVVLDILFVPILGFGIEGAAAATVLAQFLSGIGILIYTFSKVPELRFLSGFQDWDNACLREIFHLSFLTSVQQSVMNFGILMVQGLVNSFGAIVMAAFAAAVKIDSFAYMPVQDFGNAFSVFIAQNYGAGEKQRIREGIKSAATCVMIFGLLTSGIVFLFAKELLLLFLKPEETQALAVGIQYLRIEGAFYCFIGILFLLYGYFRAIQKPGVSVVLTVISLGTRVALAYLLAPISQIGVVGIWASVPIGWLLADAVGMAFLHRSQDRYMYKKDLIRENNNR